MMGTPKFVDLTDRRFGYWQVLEKAARTDNKTKWLCRCRQCGAYAIRRTSHLLQGRFAKCIGDHHYWPGRGGTPPKAPGYAACTEVWGIYRRRARARGIVFALTRDEFYALSQRPCHYCGAPPSQCSRRRHFHGPFIYNGVDRKDSSLGYDAANTVACCGRCNTMKADVAYDDFLAHVARIYARRSRGEND